MFPDPEAVDLGARTRASTWRSAAASNGCPGAPTARAEIRVALGHLARRLPGMRLAEGFEPAVHIASHFFRGLESLHVTW